MDNAELVRWMVGLAAFPTVSFVVWLVRLEGRVNAHDDTLRAFKDDLHYIRDRQDDIFEAVRRQSKG